MAYKTETWKAMQVSEAVISVGESVKRALSRLESLHDVNMTDVEASWLYPHLLHLRRYTGLLTGLAQMSVTEGKLSDDRSYTQGEARATSIRAASAKMVEALAALIEHVRKTGGL